MEPRTSLATFKQNGLPVERERSGFGVVLARVRAARAPYVSQSKLAKWSGFDHSYISRLESGDRIPTDEAVTAIANALAATEQERADLMAAAGFLPDNQTGALDPLLIPIARLLADPWLTPAQRGNIAAILAVIVEAYGAQTEREAA